MPPNNSLERAAQLNCWAAQHAFGDTLLVGDRGFALNFEIDDFSPRHQERAAELINAGLGEHFGIADPTQNPDLFDIASSYRGGCFLVAIAEESVVGTGALIVEAEFVARIVRMHTDKRFRRSGVATRMISELESRAIERGFKEVVLDTGKAWHDAIGFYLSKGYREIGRNEYGVRFHKVLGAA